ncbi:MAG: pH regulation protein F [Actinomycetaceae bacterium]|nr:pH regulation protein F [Actinomycetaceae bacterium]
MIDINILNGIVFGCGVILLISALLVLWRMMRGPTSLDRMVSLDMITSITIGGFALLAAVTRRADLLPVFVVLSLVGFVGSMALARFITPLDPNERKLLSKIEERRLDLENYRRNLLDEAPVHDIDALDEALEADARVAVRGGRGRARAGEEG